MLHPSACKFYINSKCILIYENTLSELILIKLVLVNESEYVFDFPARDDGSFVDITMATVRRFTLSF